MSPTRTIGLAAALALIAVWCATIFLLREDVALEPVPQPSAGAVKANPASSEPYARKRDSAAIPVQAAPQWQPPPQRGMPAGFIAVDPFAEGGPSPVAIAVPSPRQHVSTPGSALDIEPTGLPPESE